jgi:2-oxoglutarate ferredoxin oxidoreductase subunit delta
MPETHMAKISKGQTLVCVYPDWCKGCGLCVAFCPGKVLELNPLGKAEVAHPEECINCGFCELHCPDFAIAIKPKASGQSCPSHGKAEPNPNSDEY